MSFNIKCHSFFKQPKYFVHVSLIVNTVQETGSGSGNEFEKQHGGQLLIFFKVHFPQLFMNYVSKNVGYNEHI